MFESRRRALTALGALVGAAASSQVVPSLLAQHPSGQAPNDHHVPTPKMDNGTSEFDVTPARGAARAEQDVHYRSALRTDVERLCTMANELKEDVVHINPHDTLSVAFIKKAQAIEKLAKQITD